VKIGFSALLRNRSFDIFKAIKDNPKSLLWQNICTGFILQGTRGEAQLDRGDPSTASARWAIPQFDRVFKPEYQIPPSQSPLQIKRAIIENLSIMNSLVSTKRCKPLLVTANPGEAAHILRKGVGKKECSDRNLPLQ